MRVAVLVSPRTFEIHEVETPTVQPRQMLVRIKACGICHSEMATYLGQGTRWGGAPLEFPLRLGHEPAGVVEAVGREVTAFRPGDRVTGMGFTPSFATHAVVDFNPATARRVPRVVKVPEGVPVEQCIGEPLKCCATIARYSRVKFGDHVFVAGCGFMGLLVIAGLAARGVGELIACDVIESRLRLAKALGATATLNAREVDVAAEVAALTDGRLCDVAIEGIGHPAGVALTSRVIKPSPPPGTIILYGYHAVPDTYDLSLWGPKAPVIVSLHPAHSPDQTRDLEIAMDAVARGVYPLEKVITHTYRLEDIGRGFEDARTYPEGYVKGIVTP